MPRGWSWTSLGAIAIDMADGPFGSNLKREHYTSNKEARIIQLSNIGESGWREDNTKYTTFVHAETISRSIVSPGNLVIAKMMPAGRAIICPDVEKMYVLSSDAVKYVPSKEIFNKYLLYAINSPVVLNQIHAEVQGVTRARTSIEKLRGYLVPIPPKEEQCRIVNSIDYWLEIIGTIEQNQSFVSAATERIKARILEYAIEGKLVPQNPMDEPAIELLRRINPSFQPSHNLHYNDSIPTGWTCCPLSVVCEILDSQRKPVNSKERENRLERATTLFPYYGATGQVGVIDNYIFDGDYLLLGEDGAPFLDRHAKKAYPVSGKIWVNNHAHILKPRINRVYMLCYLNAINYRQYVTGTTRLKLTQEAMRNIPVLVPPIAEQERITSRIELLFHVIDAIQLG